MNKKKNLIVLGGGEETSNYIPLIKNIYRIILIDKNINCPSYKFSDEFIECSIYTPEIIILELHKLIKTKKIIPNGIICLGTDVPLTCAIVAKKFNLVSVPVEAAKITSNKVLIKKIFEDLKINTPKYFSTKNRKLALKYVKNQKLPIIIKPDDSRGSRGVGILWEYSMFDFLFEEAKKMSSKNIVLIEEFIDGKQISSESVVYKSNVTTPGYSDRNYENISQSRSNVIENGGDLPTQIDEQTKIKINRLIQRLSSYLKIEYGIIKGDIIIKDNKIYFIEIALRLSGGYFSSHKIPFSTGVNVLDIAVKMATKQVVKIEELKIKSNKAVSQRFLFPQDGKIKSYNKNFKNNKFNVIFSSIYIPKLKSTAFPKNHTSRMGCVICSGKNKNEAIENANKYINNIKLTY